MTTYKKIVKAKSAAATQFTSRPSTTTAKEPRVNPKASASPGRTRPIGTGRRNVRVMTASTSASYHILSAPAAPAPTAMQSNAVNAVTGCSEPGATASPTSAVKTTSDITRGFISAK